MARFGGGMPDMAKLMKQAQKMQEDAARLQQDLQASRISAQAGGGMVTATVNGHGHLVEIKINPAAMGDAEDTELLEDLIITAAKEATKKAQEEQEKGMESITGTLEGLNLPPGIL